jgi:predicted RNA binding protein YcfA (HicA-like mRNA interferase family)
MGLSCLILLRRTQLAGALTNSYLRSSYVLAAGNIVKVHEAIRTIEDDGWFLIVTRGSHRQYKHRRKAGRVTIAGKPSDDLSPGTRNSILKQAGLKESK